MFWFNPNNPSVVFCDNRRLETQAIWISGNGQAVRYCTVKPDVLADFRALPFPDESFWHVVFDPPHLRNLGDNSWMAKKYGKLPKEWMPYIRDGFRECWRVLKVNGTLVFKWSETQITTREVIDAIGVQPLYGHKSERASKTHWMAFFKETGGAK